MTLLVHILAGGLALALGAIALSATKGARLHRKSGMLFVGVMLAMSVSGMLIAAVRGAEPAVNIPAALLTAYLVVTAFTTIRPLAAGQQWLDLSAMLVAFAVGLTTLTFGFEALASGGNRNGIPAFRFSCLASSGSWRGYSIFG